MNTEHKSYKLEKLSQNPYYPKVIYEALLNKAAIFICELYDNQPNF